MVLPPDADLQGEKKQQGLTIFLVPMSDPAIEVRPIACMIGPHHLNEVFLDDVWVTEADVLGTVDEGWRVVQEVLAFERVGIARYARCERLLLRAPRCSGDVGGRCLRSCAAAGPRCSLAAAGPGCSPTGSSPSSSRGGSAPATPRPTGSRSPGSTRRAPMS